MPFNSGSISFRRFLITGAAPAAITPELLERIAQHAFTAQDLGVPEPIEYGWCSGRSILDNRITFADNVFADALHLAIRIDTHRVPPEIKKAYLQAEEQAAAAANPSGHVSKKQKRDAKDAAQRQIEQELREGKHRRSRMVPILWDIPRGILYSPITASSEEYLRELFERTFNLAIEPLTAGHLASDPNNGPTQFAAYQAAIPTAFVPGPEGPSQQASYPWALCCQQPRDFLGNEFFLWLWWQIAINGCTIGKISVLIERSIDVACAYGQTGKDTFRADGADRSPEAMAALRSGKVPRRFGLILENAGHQFSLTLSAESFAVTAAKLPDIEDAPDARTLFEERIALLRDLCQSIDTLYANFLEARFSDAWGSTSSRISGWIQAKK